MQKCWIYKIKLVFSVSPTQLYSQKYAPTPHPTNTCTKYQIRQMKKTFFKPVSKWRPTKENAPDPSNSFPRMTSKAVKFPCFHQWTKRVQEIILPEEKGGKKGLETQCSLQCHIRNLKSSPTERPSRRTPIPRGRLTPAADEKMS